MNEFEKLQRSLSAGKISRRDFINKATMMGLAAAIPASIVTEQVKAETAKKGGRFRLGVGAGSTSDALDPGLIDSVYMQILSRSVRNHLVEYTNKNELVPALAESWESSPDAKVWTFKLRKDVEFSNGRTLKASDVVASFNHHRGKDSKSAAKPLVDPVVDIKADGTQVVQFTLESGNADFPFTANDYHIPIMPANENGTVDWQSGVGTGAYVISQFEPGVRSLIKRNPNYWKPNSAYFDEAEILAILDVNARTNALTTGQIDAMDRCDLKTLHLLKRNRKVTIKEVKGRGHYTIPMLMDVAPFDNNHVRMALKLGLDREALVRTILKGHGYVGNDHPISPANRYYNTELEQRKYDPEKAKWHLSQAGLQSLDVSLSAADAAFSGAVDAGVLYKEHASKANININVVRESNDGYWSNVWIKKPFCFCYWGGRLVEDHMFSTAYIKGAAWNDTRIDIEKLNNLIVAARAELDDKKRRQMYYDMQQIVRDDGGTVVPMFYNYVAATRKNVVHPQGDWSTEWDMDGFLAIERWAFA